jgi:hypothetical protein
MQTTRGEATARADLVILISHQVLELFAELLLETLKQADITTARNRYGENFLAAESWPFSPDINCTN